MVVLSAGRERMGRLGGEAVTQMRQTTTFHLDHHDDDSHSGAETSSLETKDTPSPVEVNDTLKPSHRWTNGPLPLKTIEANG